MIEGNEKEKEKIKKKGIVERRESFKWLEKNYKSVEFLFTIYMRKSSRSALALWKNKKKMMKKKC